jgi:hypothetical protein
MSLGYTMYSGTVLQYGLQLCCVSYSHDELKYMYSSTVQAFVLTMYILYVIHFLLVLSTGSTWIILLYKYTVSDSVPFDDDVYLFPANRFS